MSALTSPLTMSRAPEGRRSWALGLALLGVAACGGGGTPAMINPDGARDGAPSDVGASERGLAADGAGVLDEAAEASDGPAREDALFDAATDVTADGRDGPVAFDGVADVAADASAADVAAERAADAPLDVAPEVAPEVAPDLAVERPSATASWTIAANPMCAAAGAGCMDTGAVGGYQVTASGSCPAASSVQLWFPGASARVAAGTYAVKAASGIFEIVAMPPGMVGVLAERDDAARVHFRYWGRAGTVTVTAVGPSRRVALAGVTLREETSGAMTTLAADVTCP